MVAHVFCAMQPQARRRHSLGGNPSGGRKAEGVKAGGSGKWEEKWISERRKEKRAKIGYMEMGKSSKDRDKEVGRKNAGCLKTETKLFAGLMSEPK